MTNSPLVLPLPRPLEIGLNLTAAAIFRTACRRKDNLLLNPLIKQVFLGKAEIPAARRNNVIHYRYADEP